MIFKDAPQVEGEPSWIRPAALRALSLVGILVAAWGLVATTIGVVHIAAPQVTLPDDSFSRLASTAIDAGGELLDSFATSDSDCGSVAEMTREFRNRYRYDYEEYDSRTEEYTIDERAYKRGLANYLETADERCEQEKANQKQQMHSVHTALDAAQSGLESEARNGAANDFAQGLFALVGGALVFRRFSRQAEQESNDSNGGTA